MYLTPLCQLPYPAPSDAADIPAHLQSLATALDSRTVLRFTDAADRTAKVTAPQAGMVAWLTTPGLLTVYNGSGWVSVHEPADSGWQTLTPGTGFVAGVNGLAGYPALQYRKIDNRVHLRGWISPATAGTVIARASTLLTLPAGARPATIAGLAAICSDTVTANYNQEGTTRLEITPAGLVRNLGQNTVAGYTFIGFPDNTFFFVD
ncbi:hypothetical protein [Streptomyces sp. H39-S7]|uniref:hypothetical protein n=1 Tax=Streptomyces sp. H39-S7 TaxID=3004357 RepID=UPI0022AFDD67|nr:hypothetical protein [Streptomyces sp. H39-S7]MCZ4117887.1 hypothetical protein [Streptomyces sp. H39-S7]